MEALVLTVLSVFAFIGVMDILFYIFRHITPKNKNTDLKLILYLPPNSDFKLEGTIRQIFYEELPEKLMTDGKIYIMVSPDDREAMRLLENLKVMFPIEVLPDQKSYCMITGRE